MEMEWVRDGGVGRCMGEIVLGVGKMVKWGYV